MVNYHFQWPADGLQDFIYGYSAVENILELKEGVIIPNGRIDFQLTLDQDNQFQIRLLGLETESKPMPQMGIVKFFTISLNPLGLEFLLNQSVADWVNSGTILSTNFLGFDVTDLNDFQQFCEKANALFLQMVPQKIDTRKAKLFDAVFTAQGDLNIKETANVIGWSERQINRYFNQLLGISLKRYCSILKFQAALSHIQEGKLSPTLNYVDQSHFIKEVKRLSGVSPKELFKNKNDRFLQFLVYQSK